VKALYSDGTESAWSNVETVTLGGEDQVHQPGDVDHDGRLTVADVAKLIGYLINGGDICTICADYNGDEAINLADMSSLITRLLAGE
jgi:hypothetical protein